MIHSHQEAIDAICGCAATVSVLSYQEAIEGYFKLRGLPIPDDAAPSSPVGEGVREKVATLEELAYAMQEHLRGSPGDFSIARFHVEPCLQAILALLSTGEAK